MDSDTTITTLNNLIETCKDGEVGFRTAAEGLQNPAMKASFIQYSQQRARFARELQEQVRKLGGDPETSGSVSGSLHRGWLNVKSAVTGQDDHAILAEAERGEDVAKAAYEDALRTALPSPARGLVQQQAVQVTAVHDHVRNVRDQHTVAR
jgi:uncharacterized protein (TIGR02284 family)